MSASSSDTEGTTKTSSRMEDQMKQWSGLCGVLIASAVMLFVNIEMQPDRISSLIVRLAFIGVTAAAAILLCKIVILRAYFSEALRREYAEQPTTTGKIETN